MGTGRSGLPKGVRDTTKKVQNLTFKKYVTESEIDAGHGAATKVFEDSARANPEYLDALHRYTGSGFRTTNPILRDPRYKDMSTEEIMQDIQNRGMTGDLSDRNVNSIVNLHKSLEVGEVTEAFVGYRGAGFSLLFGDHMPHTLAEVKSLIGTVVRDTGNMSISMIKGRQFGGEVLYKIHVPTGKSIGANVMGVSQHDSEEGEFLFNNGAYFFIKSAKQLSQHKIQVDMYYIGRA